MLDAENHITTQWNVCLSEHVCYNFMWHSDGFTQWEIVKLWEGVLSVSNVVKLPILNCKDITG